MTDDQDRTLAPSKRDRIIAVQHCPNCGANRGEPCVTTTGMVMEHLVHTIRARWASWRL